MTDRKPLIPLNEDLRRKLQEERGLDPDNLPVHLNLTPAELEAATNPGLPAPPKEQPMKVPAWLVAVAGVITTALYVAHSFLPPPWGLIAYALSFVAAFLAGVGVQAPKFITGKPVLPIALVPVVASLVPFLVTYAQGLTPGVVRSVVELLAIVATSLAGLPLDTAKAKPAEVAPAPGAP